MCGRVKWRLKEGTWERTGKHSSVEHLASAKPFYYKAFECMETYSLKICISGRTGWVWKTEGSPGDSEETWGWTRLSWSRHFTPGRLFTSPRLSFSIGQTKVRMRAWIIWFPWVPSSLHFNDVIYSNTVLLYNWPEWGFCDTKKVRRNLVENSFWLCC